VRVSVVIPAFDAERTVGAAISSALWQTYRDLEVVVVDDGSGDSTGMLAAGFPEPVRVVRHENGGVAAARNQGIAEARGELIAFCDADDVLLPLHLEALVEVYDRAGGIATSNCYWLFDAGIHPSRVRYKSGFPRPPRQRLAILEQNFVSTMSLFPKTLWEELGGAGPGEPPLQVLALLRDQVVPRERLPQERSDVLVHPRRVGGEAVAAPAVERERPRL